MRIAIDARMMGPLNTRGIGRYVEELVRAMIDLAPEHRYVLFVRDPSRSAFLDHPAVEHVKADVPWYGFGEQVLMPGFFARAKADVVHIPHWNVPLLYRGPLVTTVHDLLLMHQPASAKASLRRPLFSAIKRTGFRASVRHATRAARVTCVPTQVVANDVAATLGVDLKRIMVTGEGVPSLPPPDEVILSRYPIRDTRYFLIVGSAYPHKRIETALDAWESVSRYRPETHLVIVGEEDAFMARHVAQVKQRGLPRVHFTGRVTDAELAALYSSAELLLFPSSFEGFGLPPLEALSYQTPVVASDIPVLRETCPRDGVWFFRVGDADGMIRAIDQALADVSGARSAAAAGWAEIRTRHTWKHAAERTLDAYVRAQSTP